MNMRVTSQVQTATAIGNLQRQSAAVARYQGQVSSGVRVERASDDPARFPAIARAKGDGMRLDAYTQAVADSTADLNAGVSALQDANDVLVRAKQIAQEGANATTDSHGYQALASEVDGLLDRMLAAANTQVDGRYLFGGTATDRPPFQATPAGGKPAAVTYVGSAERGRTLVGPGGQTVDTVYDGGAVFQRGGADVFQSLVGLRDDLRNPDLTPAGKAQALAARMAQVDAARGAIGDATAEQSATLAGLDARSARLADLKLTTAGRLTDLQGTDFADAVVKMQAEQNALQATLAVAARLNQPDLLSFIR